jgi:formylglycine-generating enzyme
MIGLAVVLLAAAGTQAIARGGNAWDREGTHAGEQIMGPDGAVYVWVPAGEFIMGESAPVSSSERTPQQPAHRVRITKGFWLGRLEVTNAQFHAFCAATGRDLPTDGYPGQAEPVADVNWDDAQAYCAYYGLALPTEAEWEYAARGAEGHTYPWGNRWDAGKCWHLGRNGHARAVGSFPDGASWCGAQDMAGSVFEWCSDWYGEGYYRVSPVDDPTGPAEGTYRALRGGSWRTDDDSCRSALRNGHSPAARHNDDGFRCMVRTATP